MRCMLAWLNEGLPGRYMWNPLSWAMEVAAIIAIALLDYADFFLIIALLFVNATIRSARSALRCAGGIVSCHSLDLYLGSSVFRGRGAWCRVGSPNRSAKDRALACMCLQARTPAMPSHHRNLACLALLPWSLSQGQLGRSCCVHTSANAVHAPVQLCGGGER